MGSFTAPQQNSTTFKATPLNEVSDKFDILSDLYLESENAYHTDWSYQKMSHFLATQRCSNVGVNTSWLGRLVMYAPWISFENCLPRYHCSQSPITYECNIGPNHRFFNREKNCRTASSSLTASGLRLDSIMAEISVWDGTPFCTVKSGTET